MPPGRKRPGRWMVRLAACTAMSCLAWVLPAAAQAASSPSIDSVSVSGITSSDATLEAQINPNGLDTTYELYLSSPACQANWPTIGPCMVIQDFSVPGGSIPAGSDDQTVSIDLNSAGVKLQAGTWYEYSVSAHNAAGTVPAGRSTEHDFKTMSTSAGLPSIESESAANVTSTDARLEAEINLHEAAAGAYYQFQLVKNASEYGPEILCPTKPPPITDGCIGTDSDTALPIGFVPGNTAQPGATQSAILDLASAGVTLQPGTTYHYRILVARRVPTEDTIEWEPPTIYGRDQTFTTGRAPAIDSVSVSHVTSTDATLEAEINTEGLETSYEFQLTYTRCRECMSPTYNIPLPSGLLLGSLETQSVSVDLNSVGVTVKPGYYEYSLTATSTGGSTEAHGGTFEPPDEVLQPLNNTTSPPGSHSTTGPAQNTGQSTITPAVIAPANTVTPRPKTRTLTNVQKLAKALKLCAKKPKKERASCRKQAHKKYGKTATKAKKS